MSLDTCATITVKVDSISMWPVILTIDFGSGCTSDIDFRTRKGIVVAEFSGRYRDSGTVITISLQNYYVNGHKVEGIKLIINKGTNTGGNLEFTILDSNVVITTPDAETITWESYRTNEWVAGDATAWPIICDDIYLITGSAKGRNRDGREFTANITTALRKEICCRHMVSGVLQITPTDLSPRIIDYGSGVCDGIITITIEGVSYTVVLD